MTATDCIDESKCRRGIATRETERRAELAKAALDTILSQCLGDKRVDGDISLRIHWKNGQIDQITISEHLEPGIEIDDPEPTPMEVDSESKSNASVAKVLLRKLIDGRIGITTAFGESSVRLKLEHGKLSKVTRGKTTSLR